MLVLSRKCGETITIGDDILVKVVEIRSTRVKLAFDCPADVRIMRAEVADWPGMSEATPGRLELTAK